MTCAVAGGTARRGPLPPPLIPAKAGIQRPQYRVLSSLHVMPGLDPGISCHTPEIAGTSPAMTLGGFHSQYRRQHDTDGLPGARIKSGTRVCSGGTAELHTKAACSGLDPEPRGRLARPLCLRSFPRKGDSASRAERPCPRRADPRLRGEERPGRAREGIGISSADSILLFSLLREFRAHFLHALRNGRILAPIPFHAGACLDPTRAHAEGERRLHGPSSGRTIGEDVDRRSRTTAGPW